MQFGSGVASVSLPVVGTGHHAGAAWWGQYFRQDQGTQSPRRGRRDPLRQRERLGLETIEVEGFAPVRMEPLLKLAKIETLSDPQMVNELATQVTRAGAPAPSVETILHAVLPHKFVDHTDADAVVAITDTADGEARIREIYGEDVVIVPYVMPGFDLAKACARKFETEAKPSTIGMVLLHHGIFSFGATAKESYGRMIALVERAENYLKAKGAWEVPIGPMGPYRSYACRAGDPAP